MIIFITIIKVTMTFIMIIKVTIYLPPKDNNITIRQTCSSQQYNFNHLTNTFTSWTLDGLVLKSDTSEAIDEVNRPPSDIVGFGRRRRKAENRHRTPI